MKTYDYKDETKDVKGKVWPHHFNLLDWTSQHSAGVAVLVAGPEKRYQPDHTQPGRSYADDWKKHFQTPAKRKEVKSWLRWNRNRPRRRDGPSMASPLRHLRVFPSARDKWISGGPQSQSLRNPIVRAGFPWTLWQRGVCGTRLLKKYPSQTIRKSKYKFRNIF